MTSTTAPTWTWAVTVTTPDGQITPVITPNTFSDCTRAGEHAAEFLEILGENTEFEAFANSVAKSIRLISCPEGAAPAQSVHAGIYSAHIMPVAPGQSPQQAWEQHMPPAYVRRLTTAFPSPAVSD
ncbi:hypothetical protein [Streptomyces goshikiensis]|uniref:hypothetical protein n=1 Tax=Streptomyces goshikiensis TaxID=1942 RepID=UPI0036669073